MSGLLLYTLLPLSLATSAPTAPVALSLTVASPFYRQPPILSTSPLNSVRTGSSIVGQFTHWSFGQLASLADVPAAYIRNSGMPGALAADNVNWGLHHSRTVEDVSVLIRKRYDANGENGSYHIGAFNGPELRPRLER
jgi:hypothetical protein